MIDNFTLQFLCGGRHACDPSWDKTSDAIDQCHKFYFPVHGQATLSIDGQQHAITPGRAYYISGFHIDWQRCAHQMDVYWVHFAPESLQLSHLLSKLPALHAWKPETDCFTSTVQYALQQLFDRNVASEHAGELCRRAAYQSEIQTLSQHLLSELFQTLQPGMDLETGAIYKRLRPSIDYMNENLQSTLSLADIAAPSHLAPNYFHRLFTTTFGITPLDYFTRRRMEIARQRLLADNARVKDVAFQLGFKSEFYFSRVFKKHVKISPSQYRKQNGSL